MNVLLSLGSNLGDRDRYLENGIRSLEERAGTVRKRSATLDTPAYGLTDQPDFRNLALELETALSPEELLSVLHEIEQEQDRVRLIHWGPRTLDLDIVYYGALVMETEDLTIPHRDRLNRDFVLRPLAEIAPDFVDPVEQKTILTLLRELEQRSDGGPKEEKNGMMSKR